MASNSDNYEFAKSATPQSVSSYSAFSDKQYGFLNDVNNGVYSTNGGLTSVEWDLTSIYNSSNYSDASNLFMTIPIVLVATTSNGAVLTAPPTGASSLVTLKNGYQGLVHQIEITANGKTIHDTQAFQSLYTNFKMLSSMSANDLQCNAPTLGLAPMLDNEKSMRYFSAAAPGGTAQNGIGITNNLAFNIATATGLVAAAQNSNSFNPAVAARASRIADTTATGNAWNNFYGAGKLLSATELIKEFKPYFTVAADVMYWYDVAVIPLKYLVDGIDKLGLVKKLDLKVRIYLNCGSIQSTILTPNTFTNYGAWSSNFGGSCPLSINYLGPTSLTAATTLITAGCFVARNPSSMGTGTAIATPQVSHPMGACRMYYSQVKLEPSKDIAYRQANSDKLVVYERILYNTDANISVGMSYSKLINSGIKNPIGIAIIPLIAKATAGYSQYESPYDQCPSTYSPLSLTNLQVSLGGVNMLSTTLSYTFENFIEQVALAETLTSADIGLSVGLIGEQWWENNRVYWVDLARSRDADKTSERNVNVSFTNNSLVAIDVVYFTVYLDSFKINIERGIVNK